MNKTIFLGLTIGVIAVAMIALSTVSNLDFIVMGATKIPGTETCKSDFWSRTCCWTETSAPEPGGTRARVCETCLDNGDGTYRDCKRHKEGTAPPLTRPEGDIFGDIISTPGPAAQDTPNGPGIFQGDIIQTPGPAAQDQPSTTQGGPAPGGIFQPIPQGPAAQDMPGPGIFQGNLLESYSQLGLVQSDPDSETNTTQPGGTFLEDLGQLGATQNNETTSEEGMTQEPPATEENTTAVPTATEDTQPALIQEEPVPPCPEGQILDEETNLCVLEDPEADETGQEEQEQPQQEEAEEEPSSESG